MLVATQLTRSFVFTNKGQRLTLADPGPVFKPADVLNFYAATYPELITAKITGPEIVGDAVQFSFVSTVGTKG